MIIRAIITEFALMFTSTHRRSFNLSLITPHDFLDHRESTNDFRCDFLIFCSVTICKSKHLADEIHVVWENEQRQIDKSYILVYYEYLENTHRCHNI